MYAQEFRGTDVHDPDLIVADPVELMMQWLPPPPEGDPSRTIMSLATIGLDGYPNTRHVLASEVSREGISFHVSSKSAKVAELAACPRAAITIAWPQQGKQIIVQGDVIKQNKQDADRVYRERSNYLQLLAHVNTDKVANEPALERAKVWTDFVAKNPDASKLEPPQSWLGFILHPVRISFWRAVPDTPSNRHDYRLVEREVESEQGTHGSKSWVCEVVSG